MKLCGLSRMCYLTDFYFLYLFLARTKLYDYMNFTYSITV